MSRPKWKRHHLLFALLLIAVASLACGRKGDPYPRKELHKPGSPKAAPKSSPKPLAPEKPAPESPVPEAAAPETPASETPPPETQAPEAPHG